MIRSFQIVFVLLLMLISCNNNNVIQNPDPTPSSGFPFPTWTSDIPAIPPSATGKTYYVDGTAGDDAKAGTLLATAFKTVSKAVSSIAAGDTVLIRKGLYREGIVLINTPSGTSTKPITFGSYGDGEVILDGSSKVTGWTKVTGTVWKAPVSFNPIGIVVNDVPLKQVTQGQNGSTAPQVGLAGVTSGSGKWHIGGGFITADMGGSIGSSDPNNADIVVPNDDGAQTHVYFYQKDYINFKGLTIRGSGAAGIWGYGSHNTVERCNIQFNGKGAVSFLGYTTDNLQSTDNAVLLTRAYQNVLINWPRGNNYNAEAGGGWPGAVGWSFNLRPVARGNIVYMNGGEGIISYGTTSGITTGSALFEQNLVYDNWSVNMYFDNQPNSIARNNFIYNHPMNNANYLYVGEPYPYNQLGKYGACLMIADEQNSSDTTGNYANLENTKIYNNIIAGCRIGIRDYAEGAITIPNHGLKNTLIANNTIIMPQNPIPNTNSYGIFLEDNTNVGGSSRNVNTKIQNNLIYGFNDDSVIYSASPTMNGITLNNNLYFSQSAKPFGSGSNASVFTNFSAWKTLFSGSDTNSQFIDPQLKDILHFFSATPVYDPVNAKLLIGSKALGAGVAQTEFTTNFAGQPRVSWNVGAY